LIVKNIVRRRVEIHHRDFLRKKETFGKNGISPSIENPGFVGGKIDQRSIVSPEKDKGPPLLPPARKKEGEGRIGASNIRKEGQAESPFNPNRAGRETRKG